MSRSNPDEINVIYLKAQIKVAANTSEIRVYRLVVRWKSTKQSLDTEGGRNMFFRNVD
jgi:hypothetical protein